MVQYPSKMHANKQLVHSRNWKWLYSLHRRSLDDQLTFYTNGCADIQYRTHFV